MKAETITWGNLVLRKEAIVGINMNQITGITIYLIGGQSIQVDGTLANLEADYKRLKSMASL